MMPSLGGAGTSNEMQTACRMFTIGRLRFELQRLFALASYLTDKRQTAI